MPLTRKTILTRLLARLGDILGQAKLGASK